MEKLYGTFDIKGVGKVDIEDIEKKLEAFVEENEGPKPQNFINLNKKEAEYPRPRSAIPKEPKMNMKDKQDFDDEMR